MSLEQEDSQEPLPPAPDCEDAAPPEWLEKLRERSEWGLGAILGPTGSGKTRALSTLKYAGLIDGVLRRTDVAATWPKNQAIISAIAKVHGTPQRAIDRLSSVGLNTLPAWLRQFPALSNGQRARAACARNLGSRRAMDDFAATVDEDNANCFAAGLAKLVRREKLKNVVVATTRRGVAAWSQAEWCLVLDGDARLIFNPGVPPERPRVSVTMITEQTDEAFARSQRASVATAATRREPVLAPWGPPRLLKSAVQQDAATEAASAAFEVEFSGEATFQHSPLEAPEDPWRVGLLYGPSGTGKSLILAELTGSARVDGDVRVDLGNAADPDALEALGGDALLDAISRGDGCLSSGERELQALARLCTVAATVDASITLPFRRVHVPRAAAASIAAPPPDPFAVGATVELRGLVSNAAANGRHVVVERTPPDIAAKGRVNVVIDGRVRAVKRKNLLPVSPAGVGGAPSSAAMGWLTPGFCLFISTGLYESSETRFGRKENRVASSSRTTRSHHRSRSHHARSAGIRHSL